jgi:hypothetical protein
MRPDGADHAAPHGDDRDDGADFLSSVFLAETIDRAG